MRRPLSSHALVALQLIGLFGCCMPFGGNQTGPVAALALCALGATLGIATLCYNRPGNFSIYPEMHETTVLITDGPYRLVRHPMYVALVTMMAGIVAYNGQPANYLAFVLICAVTLTKALREERYLAERFDEYAHYMSSTRRFVPFVW